MNSMEYREIEMEKACWDKNFSLKLYQEIQRDLVHSNIGRRYFGFYVL